MRLKQANTFFVLFCFEVNTFILYVHCVDNILYINSGTLIQRNQKGTMASMGLEPMTFALLARRSNQLS